MSDPPQKLGGRQLVELTVGSLAHQNWHVREELLHVLIMCCLLHKDECGLSEYLLNLVTLVEDAKAKVRTTALEVLVVVSYYNEDALSVIRQLVDVPTYAAVHQRVQAGVIAALNYEGIVELPAVPFEEAVRMHATPSVSNVHSAAAAAAEATHAYKPIGPGRQVYSAGLKGEEEQTPVVGVPPGELYSKTFNMEKMQQEQKLNPPPVMTQAALQYLDRPEIGQK